MTTATNKAFMTVTQAAKRLGVSSGRIRQILAMDAPKANVEIGQRFGWAWMLTSDDLDKISRFIRKQD